MLNQSGHQEGFPRIPSISTNSHFSFLSNVYLDPHCAIPESPTISPDSFDDPNTSTSTSELTPVSSDHTDQTSELLRQLSRESDEYEYEYEDLELEELNETQVCIRSNTLKHQIPISLSTQPGIGGGTKPLRVKKKKGVTAVKVGSSKGKKRRSTLSFPHSPLSRSSFSYSTRPNSPRLPNMLNISTGTGPKPRRNPSSNSTKSNLSKTHANISNLFLSLPVTSPSPIEDRSFMRNYQDITQVQRGNNTKKNRITSESSLHLGLGKFNSYDQTIFPGPSPPMSPQPSPTKRAFISSTSTSDLPAGTADQYRKKSLPPSPLTPSRAPRKAAALLGTGPAYHNSSSNSQSKKNKVHGLNGKHFRPLPNSTLTEINKFFGDIPKKPSLKSASSGLGSKSNTSKSKSTTVKMDGIDERGNGDRNIGSGETVHHKAEDGSMWLDVEEEQEFAWLLSEIFALIPQPLPDLTRVKSNQSQSTSSLVHEGAEEEENKWEMENFTSVLSLPKPKKAFGGSTKEIPIKPIKGLRNNQLDDSFLNLDSETPKISRSFNNNNTKHVQMHPWSNPSSTTHKRSLSNPTSPSPILDKSTISNPMPTLIPPPRISSKNKEINHSFSAPSSFSKDGAGPVRGDFGYNSGSGSGSDSDLSTTSLSASPPRTRIKNRPPPLTLKPIKPSSKLPILTATTPHDGNLDLKPSNIDPAKKDRSIVASKERSKPMAIIAQPPQQKYHKYEAPNTPFVRPRTAPKPLMDEVIPPLPLPKTIYAQPKPQPQPQREEPISFFEPVTSTESISLAHALRSKGIPTNNGGRDRDNKEKTSWLKRVVRRPLGGGSIKV